MPDTKPYTVQLEDRTIETFLIDSRVSPEMLPTLLEGAVRARQRQKTGQPPPVPPSTPPVFGPTLTENVRRGISGALQVPIDLGKNLLQGLSIANKSPSAAASALAFLPDVIKARVRESIDSADAATKAHNQGDYIGEAKNFIKSIPIVGDVADTTGQAMAAGQGPEALGNVGGQALLGVLAGRYGGQALRRATAPAAPATLAPEVAPSVARITAMGQAGDSIPITPSIPPTPPSILPSAGEVPNIGAMISSNPEFGASPLDQGASTAATSNTLATGADTSLPAATHRLASSMAADTGTTSIPNTIDLGTGAGLTDEAITRLKQQLASSPAPIPAGGTPAIPPSIKFGPVTIDLTSGPKLVAARALLSSARGSAAEKLWAQRLLSGIAPDRSQDTEGDQWRPAFNF